MFRILIGNDAMKWAKTGSGIFETDDLAVADNKFLELIATYPTMSVQLVEMRTPLITIDGTSQNQYTDITSTRIVNDGATFHLDASFANENAVCYDYDATLKAEIIAEMTALGLTNITFTPWGGINATNPTGAPIVATYTIPNGLIKLIDSTTKDSNWVNNPLIITL
jgi:hypothetical protein